MAGKILIVDDVATNRIVLKVKLSEACYGSVQAASGAEALAIARRDSPDLVLLDLDLPDMPGAAVVRAIRSDPALRQTPVIVYSAGAEGRIAALEAGADACLRKPIDDQCLLARIRRLLRERDALTELHRSAQALGEVGMADAAADFAGAAVVSVVAPRRDQAMRWRGALGRAGRYRVEALTREEALADPGTGGADLFVIDAGTAPAAALHLMSDLRSRAATRDAALCLVASGLTPAMEAIALDLGADDAMDEQLDPAEFGLRIAAALRRKRHADRLRREVGQGLRLAAVDPLTGLRNRRAALPALRAIAERARAAAQDCAVLVIDIDRFKTVNDRFGHSAGDAVLAEVASRLAAAAPGADLLARIGGEEFLAVFTGLDAAQAAALAERLRRAVDCRPVALPGALAGTPGQALTVTVSIGLAHAARACAGDGALFDRADQALLAAKRGGRNRVTSARAALA
jgi:two-component system cell cycle response regulator